ncbi:MAG TPA: 5-deoxy-glucuronate isomerase [Casimicrobiaceae bacterium]|nr:5-deoxy-glucuronate isomerase [Casimicrobiaceae bacterium]
MSLLVKARREGRDIVRVTPQSAGWRYVGFSAHRLRDGETLAIDQPQDELCIVVLGGVVSVRQHEGGNWPRIGARGDVFDDAAPYAVYLPQARRVDVVAHGDAQVGVASAPGPGDAGARLLEPSQMRRSVRGSGLNTRYVCDILPQSEPASHLLVVEVRTPSGHSSSYPPHKHDADNLPLESALEETYYHRLKPAQGFAFQRVYTDDRVLDEALAVEDHDVVLVPRGYHPVVVPYGYESYYLNVMAGPTREWHFRNDPAHEWMLVPGAIK